MSFQSSGSLAPSIARSSSMTSARGSDSRISKTSGMGSSAAIRSLGVIPHGRQVVGEQDAGRRWPPTRARSDRQGSVAEPSWMVTMPDVARAARAL